MAATRNRASRNLRGHEYVTGKASPLMESGEESSRFSPAKGLAEEAVAALSSGVKDALGSMVQCVTRHPFATVCLGLCLAVALTAVFGGLPQRMPNAER
jgi:hypothetical protein